MNHKNSNFGGKPYVFHDPEFLVMPWETDEIYLELVLFNS